MGDLQVCLPQPNGILNEEGSFLSSLSSPSSPSCNPHPLSISDENWLRAEQTTREIICRIQPTVVSEQRRKEVIDYVQRLISGYLGSEVFPFGSVPLKTYLPDGDIDLTALSSPNAEDSLVNDVRSVLEGEEQNNTAEFEVKDVQYIHAEVKLVKCLVRNVVVDISFNQLGGLSTLCFLEKVDFLIGKDHLFKRSIILIKAWCYYESRILGAHHGLISTYALETLVLYIVHLFHSSLGGPLAVLYRFLDYFSKFDWDNYCISLNGPVCISSLPEIVAETPENGGDVMLLGKEFLRNCVERFAVPSRGLETNSRAFSQKHLNIVDPLKENNNLGRSVSKGNFYRIRSAFTYGARKLGRILLLPKESVGDELNKFFMNTLDRHGSGQRPDVQDPLPTFGWSGSGLAFLKPDIEKCRDDKIISELPSIDSGGSVGESRIDHLGAVCEGISNIRILNAEKKPGTQVVSESQGYPTKVAPSPMVLESDALANGTVVAGYRLAGDAKDLATSRVQGPKNTSDTSKSTPLSSEPGTSPFGKSHHAPDLNYSYSFPEKGKHGNGNCKQTMSVNSSILEKAPSRLRLSDEENGLVLQPDLEGTETITGNTSYSCSNCEDATSVGSTNGLIVLSSVAHPSEDLCLGPGGSDTASTTGSPEALNYLSDLSSEFQSHLDSLDYGRWYHGYALPFYPPSPSPFQTKHAWDNLHSLQFKWNRFPHANANSVLPGPLFYPVNPSILSGVAFGVEEMPKPRGTGTYFPNMVQTSSLQNHRSNRERPSLGRGKNPPPVTHSQLHKPSRNNGRAMTQPETNLVGSHELSQAQLPVFPGRGKPGSIEFFQPGHPITKGYPCASGFSLPSERLEFGSFGHHLPLGARLIEGSRQPDSVVPHTQGSMSSLQTVAMHRLGPALGMNQERVTGQSYHLKDDDDFPPLST